MINDVTTFNIPSSKLFFWNRKVSILEKSSSEWYYLVTLSLSFSLKWRSKHHWQLNGPCENVSSGICGQQRPRSACASVQDDQEIHCPITESLDTTEGMNGDQMPGWNFAHAQYDLNLCILHMFEGSFSLGVGQVSLTLFLIAFHDVKSYCT